MIKLDLLLPVKLWFILIEIINSNIINEYVYLGGVKFVNIKIVVFLFISVSLFGESSIISGFLNDNYTGTLRNGVSGRYLGADDFLTFSLFTLIKKDQFKISLHDQIVTSRKFNYRYDIFHSTVHYYFEKKGFTLTPYLGIIIKSNLGGEDFQNTFHRVRDLPPLHLEYTKSELKPLAGFDLKLYKKNVLLYRDKIACSINIDVPFGIKPISETIYGTYEIYNSIVNFEFLAGHKFYFNYVSQYSEFVSSGWVVGAMSVFKLWRDLSINAGFFFFPSNNLENDPLYMDIDHSYSPQFWIGIGLNGENFSIQDIVKF